MKIRFTRSKVVFAAMAAVCCAAILLTGTFAWQRTISKTNEFTGSTGGTVHDDFDPDAGMKDVYVENTSNKTLYERLMLNEYMDLASCERPNRPDWQAHTHGTAPEDCGHANDEGDKFHDYFTWSMGGGKYYMPSAGKQAIVQDTAVYNGTEDGVQQTPDAQIIAMGKYSAMPDAEKEGFIGWVMDTDGYAYWSQPLRAGDVTGLLLSGVTKNGSKAAELEGLDYYYAIDVIAELVDSEDLAMWSEGAKPASKGATPMAKATESAAEMLGVLKAIADKGAAA
jgi:hypothetical protein